ncbi:hypothetical protein ACRQ5Q_10965 [Bradyrhizobium sp. PMVTL-01]|uniref:hypothetical protein n=1 Tax=Bradyrhizobium sp. PMVTL-01 TaxID=3434999 RepID=UPI003F712591
MAKAAASQKGKKAKPKLKLSDKEQSERFIETARELGSNESEEDFERIFKKIVRPKLKAPSSE